MTSGIVVIIIFVALALVISQLNTVRKSAATPLRKKGLNELKETLPRTARPRANSNTEDGVKANAKEHKP